MELEILYAIQKLHSDWLDSLMVLVTSLSNHGEIWIAIAVILLSLKKTRKCGIVMSVALILMLILGNGVLKNLFRRERPCFVDSSIAMVIKAPASYSFPSGHTFASFTGAFSIFFFHKKWGIAALALAGCIAFSRMYLFVHYPTDIFGGILFGYLTAQFAYRIIDKQKMWG